MTFLGKLLSFLNLVAGLGLLTWAVTTFTLRPGYFDPPPAGPAEKGLKGAPAFTFEGEKRDAEGYARQASVDGGRLGASLKLLAELEVRRDARREAYEQRLKWAQTGNPKDKSGAGFYKEVDPGVIPAALEDPERGPDNQPLRGIDALQKQRAADVLAVAELAKQVGAARRRYAELGAEVVRNDARLVAMTAIRDQVLAEAFYLQAVEVNVYETRETVLRRKRQLDRRLAELGGK